MTCYRRAILHYYSLPAMPDQSLGICQRPSDIPGRACKYTGGVVKIIYWCYNPYEVFALRTVFLQYLFFRSLTSARVTYFSQLFRANVFGIVSAVAQRLTSRSLRTMASIVEVPVRGGSLVFSFRCIGYQALRFQTCSGYNDPCTFESHMHRGRHERALTGNRSDYVHGRPAARTRIHRLQSNHNLVPFLVRWPLARLAMRARVGRTNKICFKLTCADLSGGSPMDVESRPDCAAY
jgi:hypothetical protein